MNKTISIIGSGFSSLSAACYLAKAGNNVTVYEKNGNIGGRARQYKNEGFLFDIGQLSGCGPTGAFVPPPRFCPARTVVPFEAGALGGTPPRGQVGTVTGRSVPFKTQSHLVIFNRDTKNIIATFCAARSRKSETY